MKPKQKYTAGSISCALWENDATIDGRNVTVLRATVERRYKDKDGTWKSSNSFGRNEIPLVVYALQKAYAAMIEGKDEEEDGPMC